MTIQEEKRHQKYIILFPIANLGYQLKIQVARGNFKWSTGYRATVNTYSATCSLRPKSLEPKGGRKT